MLKITGGVLLLVGAAMGVALVAAPFGALGAAASSIAPWLLFPGAFVAGALLIALDDARSFAGVARLSAVVLLALAVSSLLGIALPVLGLTVREGSAVPLWYVLVLSGAAGTACALTPSVGAAGALRA